MRTFQVEGRELQDETYRSNIIRQWAKIQGETFIDLGANEGYESMAMARLGAKSVLAIDARDRYVEIIRQRALEKNLPVTAQIADVRRIDEQNLGKFDNVLFFGLLYHMTNPFNLLKRLRNICGGNLFLETHVAPETKTGLLPKHERGLTNRLITVSLDGQPYPGRVWLSEVSDIWSVTGSIDSEKTFWVTAPALKSMLEASGFEIRAFLFDAIPSQYQPWASLTNLGPANTKILAWCRVREPQRVIPVVAPQTPPLPVAFGDFAINLGRRVSNRLKEKLRWRQFKSWWQRKP